MKTRVTSRMGWASAALALGLICPIFGQQSGTWTNNGSGDWSESAKWDPGIADGVDNTATFRPNTAVAITVTVDTSRTIGYLVANQKASYMTTTIRTNGAAGSGLTLQTTPPDVPRISSLVSASFVVASPLSGTQGVEIFSAQVGASGPVTLSSPASDYSGDTVVVGGRLRLGQDGGTNYPVTAGAVGTGRLVLENGCYLSSDGTTTRNIYNELVLNGDVTVGDGADWGGLYMRGPVTLTGDRVWNSVGANNTIIEGVIDDGGAGYCLTIIGPRGLSFRAQSTYGGGTVLDRGSGITSIGADTTGDPPISGPFGTGSVSLVSGALSAEGSTPRTISNPFSLDGDVSIGNGTGYGPLTFTRPITLTGNRLLTMTQNSSQYEVFRGGLNDGGNGYVFTLKGYSGWLHVGGTNVVGGGIRVHDAEFTLEPDSVWTGVPVMTLENWRANLRFLNTTGSGADGPPVVFSRSTPIVWNQGNAGGTWTVPSLTRGGRATLVIGGHKTGSIYMGPAGPLGATDRFKVTSSPPATSNGMVAPCFIESTTDFLTYNAAGNGFERVTYTVNNAIDSAGPTDLLYFNAGQTLNSSREIYAVRGELNGIANGGGGPYTLTLGSGALHIRTGTTATKTVAPHLQFGASGQAEGFVFAGISGDNQVLALTGSLIGTNGVTFSGYSTTELSGDSRATLSGPVTVNSGTLRLGSSDSLPTNMDLSINGGTFDLNGFTQSVANLTTSGGVLYNRSGSGQLGLGTNVVYDGYFDQGQVYPNTGGATLEAVLTGPITFTVADGYSAGSSYYADLQFGGYIGSAWRKVPFTGTGPITKKGPGFLQFTSDTNTFAGDINIEEGILDGVMASNPSYPFGETNRIYLKHNGIISFNVSSGGNVGYISDVRFSGGNGFRARTGGTAGIPVRLAMPATIERLAGSRGTLRLTGYIRVGVANDDWASNHSLVVYEWTNSSPLVNGMLPAYWVHTGWNNDNELAAYVGVSASARVQYTSGSKTTFSGAGATDRVYLSAAEGISADAGIWALQTANDVTVSGGDPTITLGSGGMIVNGTNTVAPKLKFGTSGTAEGLVFVASGRTATLSGALTTTAGLTKFGDGILSLTAGNSGTLSGDHWINNGTLRLGHANALASASAINIERGAVLDIGGNYTLNNAINGLGDITTGANLLTLGASGSVAPGFAGTCGTLTAEDLDFQGTYNWEYDGTTNDILACTTLAFGGGTATVNGQWIGSGDAADARGEYTLFTYEGADPVLPTWTVTMYPVTEAAEVSLDTANKRVVLTVRKRPSRTVFTFR